MRRAAGVRGVSPYRLLRRHNYSKIAKKLWTADANASERARRGVGENCIADLWFLHMCTIDNL